MWTPTWSGTRISRPDGAGNTASDRCAPRLAETKERGYAVNPGLIVEGSWGLGAAVFDRSGRPEWALSLTGVGFRFGPDRIADLGRTLLSHAHQLSARIAGARR